MKTFLPYNFKGSHPNAKFPKQAKLTKLWKIRSYLSRTRVRLLGWYVAAKVTKCKITETVVTLVLTLCNAIFKIDKASRAWYFYPIWWFFNWVELCCDNENCFTIKFQGQSPKCKISKTSQVNEIVKNTQLSHSCTIVLSVCRCQGNEMQDYRNWRYFGVDYL